MGAIQRVTNQQVLDAYRQTGSVWRGGKLLGIGGQSLWERLKALGIKLAGARWDEDELAELTSLSAQCTIGEISRRLGRSYPSVACKLSELGLGVRFGNNQKRKVPRGAGLDKKSVQKLVALMGNFEGSLRQFSVQRGLDVESLVCAFQKYDPGFWEEYVKNHSELASKLCPNCELPFIPLTTKQLTCTRRCSSLRRNDLRYFGGKRRDAVGMREGMCQLCEREKKILAAHHIFGKENDPENEYLVALCNGDHSLVGTLGARVDVLKPEFWEHLISLAVARKLGNRTTKPIGFHVCVEIEEVSEEDVLLETNLS